MMQSSHFRPPIDSEISAIIYEFNQQEEAAGDHQEGGAGEAAGGEEGPPGDGEGRTGGDGEAGAMSWWEAERAREAGGMGQAERGPGPPPPGAVVRRDGVCDLTPFQRTLFEG